MLFDMARHRRKTLKKEKKKRKLRKSQTTAINIFYFYLNLYFATLVLQFCSRWGLLEMPP